MEIVRSKTNLWASIILKSVLVAVGLIGLITNFTDGSFMGSSIALLYFTIQSNITIIWITLIILIFDIILLVKGTNLYRKGWQIMKYSFTVAITLTFLVFFMFLVPNMDLSSNYLFSFTNLSVHLIVPILTIADFIAFDNKINFKPKEKLASVIMPIYYLVFSLICSFCGVRFGSSGQHVPYFFLDYKILGWFNISKEGLGVVYWIIILTAVVIGIGYLLIFLSKLFTRQIKIKKNQI